LNSNQTVPFMKLNPMRAFPYAPHKLIYTFIFILSCAFAQAQTSGECTGFRTQTQGGWGADPHGGNNGTYLHANFSEAFPSGVTIGCDGGNKLVLTNAQAVTDFLPSGTTPSVLPAGTLTDPGGSYSNVLAGQLVTAVLNAGFDAYDPDFSSNAIHTGDLMIASGTFAGWTVNQLIAEASNTIGGCSSTYSPSDLNDALTAFNENYDNGTTDKGYTTCHKPCNIAVTGTTTDNKCNGATEGSIDITVSGANGNVTYLWNDGNTSEDRTSLATGTYSVKVTDATGCSAEASFTITQPVKALKIRSEVTPTSAPKVCDGTANLKAVGGTGPYTYQWHDGYVGATRTGLCKGAYIVTVTDANGCSVCCRIKITCAATSQLSASSASALVGKQGDAAIAPNPTKGLVKLTVNAKAAGSASINVYDMNGKKLMSEKTSVTQGSNIKSLDLSKYTKGLYSIEFVTGSEKKTMKVIVE
jgi:hypothetical protein